MSSSVATAADRTVDDEVLAVVAALVGELGSGPPAGGVCTEHSLDRDLGLGSLERVELALRLEQALGVALADEVMAVDSVGDLVRAARTAGARLPEALPVAPVVRARGVAAPRSARTLTEVLAWHASRDPDRGHVWLHEDGREERITYGGLWRGASAIAGGLQERGLERGASVAIMLRTEPAFFTSLFGVLLAGGVPVPIYPPFRLDRLEEYARRQVGVLRNAEARWLLTFPEAERVGRLLGTRVETLRGVVVADRLAEPGAIVSPSSDRDAPALIQYTSGSTGDPKGVLLTHANLLANIQALGEALGIGGDDVAVSWLPLYHDMGLIGMWLGSLYWAVPVTILSPLAFLARPARWLRAIHAHRGTVSAAPNFAFDLCARKLPDGEIEGLDLGSWRLALNGSEPVSAETIDRFNRRFAPHGFRPEAMCPAYGLAESCVGLTLSLPGRGPRVERVAREVFARERRAVPAAPDEPSPLALVSCGQALPGHEVRIADASGATLGERAEGRVLFRGPSVTRGYFRNPDATRAVVVDGWMDSGDLGWMADGELYVTGRRKDLIIKAGRNLVPQEIEAIAADVPGIRRGCIAAFGVGDVAIGTERLVVVAETRETATEARERLRGSIVDRVAAGIGMPPDSVLIVPPGTVLKTPSGKIRRAATRDAFLTGGLGYERPSVRRQWLGLVLGGLRARAWRLAGTAGHLAYAARVGAVLLVALPVLAILMAVMPVRVVDTIVRRWCRLVLALAGCALHVDGLEHLPCAGPAVLVANHASYVDAVALLAAIPMPFRFVAKRELVRWPIVGTVIAKAGHLTVDRADVSRSVADAARVTAALEAGERVLVFPEGTFRRAPGLLPFRLGAFKAAADTRSPVVPVAIRGTRAILPADAWLPRRGPIAIRIGEPLTGGTDWRAMVRSRDRAREAIASGCEEPAR
jgi:1-acyl-sn-glycerol-3-phosphate acyltransferase